MLEELREGLVFHDPGSEGQVSAPLLSKVLSLFGSLLPRGCRFVVGGLAGRVEERGLESLFPVVLVGRTVEEVCLVVNVVLLVAKRTVW